MPAARGPHGLFEAAEAFLGDCRQQGFLVLEVVIGCRPRHPEIGRQSSQRQSRLAFDTDRHSDRQPTPSDRPTDDDCPQTTSPDDQPPTKPPIVAMSCVDGKIAISRPCGASAS